MDPDNTMNSNYEAGLELFVPGRVCLLGEHTDWAVLHRGCRSGETVLDGHCLVYGTSCGLHARASKVPLPPTEMCHRLHVRAVIEHPPQRLQFPSSPIGGGETTFLTDDNGGLVSTLDVVLSPPYANLSKMAQAGTFFAYVAGAVLEVLEKYPDAFAIKEGCGAMQFIIDNDRTNLPVGKGLSSSAAVCVLIVRALSRLVGVTLSPSEEMELAYRGERRTPSRCGRMDQCVAFGSVPLSLVFHGEAVRCERIAMGGNMDDGSLAGEGTKMVFYFVVADMNRRKDTQRILKDLNECFTVDPSAEQAAQVVARAFLGQASREYVMEAIQALSNGSAEALGAVFRAYQAAFDAALSPVCPELLAPRLHELLEREDIKKLTFGGKGVGSQGDGTVQFVCRGKEAQHEVAAILTSEGCHAFEFELSGATD